jgi:hypothetical protein
MVLTSGALLNNSGTQDKQASQMVKDLLGKENAESTLLQSLTKNLKNFDTFKALTINLRDVTSSLQKRRSSFFSA